MELTPNQAIRESWNSSRKIAFRFFLLFFLLQIIPFPLLDVLLGLNLIINSDFIFTIVRSISAGHTAFIDSIALWVGHNLLGIEEINTAFGSIDANIIWLRYFGSILLAVTGCLIWSIFDRRRKSYYILQKWLILFLSYYWATTMLSYGVIKLALSQMPEGRSLEELDNIIGRYSRMSLYWMSVGASDFYQRFAGFMEIIPALLLLFSRTRMMGSLIAVAVAGHVFIINIGYNIGVKSFSAVLLLVAVYLLISHSKRLWSFFVLNRVTTPEAYSSFFTSKIKNQILIGFLLLFLISYVHRRYSSLNSPVYIDYAYKVTPYLQGIYEVKTFVKNSDTLPPLLTDTYRWHKMYIEKPEKMSLRTTYGQIKRYAFKPDSLKQKVSISAENDSVKYELDYQQLDSKDLIIHGNLEGDSIYVYLNYVNKNDYLLAREPFKWVHQNQPSIYDDPKPKSTKEEEK